MTNPRIYKLLTLAILLLFANTAHSQDVENVWQTRTNVDLSFKLLKDLKLTISPELRLDDEFETDQYLLEGELDYDITKFLSIGTSYGVVGDVKKNETEYLTRYAFSATVSQKFNRFEPSFRLMYSNYSDDDITDKSFLRYRAKVKYNIANCSLTPIAAAQVFQDVNSGDMFKVRYALGAEYKLFKDNYISAAYKLDYYAQEYRNKHIVSVGYKIRF